MPFYLGAVDVKAQPQKGGVFNFLDNLVSFVDRTSSAAKNTLENVGQIKARVKTLGTNVKQDTREISQSWQDNIRETPRDKQEDWIKGIPNGVVIGGAAGVVFLLVLMGRKN